MYKIRKFMITVIGAVSAAVSGVSGFYSPFSTEMVYNKKLRAQTPSICRALTSYLRDHYCKFEVKYRLCLSIPNCPAQKTEVEE